MCLIFVNLNLSAGLTHFRVQTNVEPSNRCRSEVENRERSDHLTSLRDWEFNSRVAVSCDTPSTMPPGGVTKLDRDMDNDGSDAEAVAVKTPMDPASVRTSAFAENLVPVRAESPQADAQGTPKSIHCYLDFLQRHGMVESRSSLAVYQVHEDLRLVRGWCNLRVVNDATVFLLGTAAPGFDSVFPGEVDPAMDRTQAVVPLQNNVTLSPRLLFDMGKGIKNPMSHVPFRCITLAIVDSDSTTAYYRIFNTFDEIVHPQWKTKKAKSGGQPGEGAAEDAIQAESGSESGDLGSDDSDQGPLEL